VEIIRLPDPIIIIALACPHKTLKLSLASPDRGATFGGLEIWSHLNRKANRTLLLDTITRTLARASESMKMIPFDDFPLEIIVLILDNIPELFTIHSTKISPNLQHRIYTPPR
jgi:hypothetical protein